MILGRYEVESTLGEPNVIFEPATLRLKSLFKGQLHYNAFKGSMQGIWRAYKNWYYEEQVGAALEWFWNMLLNTFCVYLPFIFCIRNWNLKSTSAFFYTVFGIKCMNVVELFNFLLLSSLCYGNELIAMQHSSMGQNVGTRCF